MKSRAYLFSQNSARFFHVYNFTLYAEFVYMAWTQWRAGVQSMRRPASGVVFSYAKRRWERYRQIRSVSLIYLITLGILYLWMMTKGTSIRQASTDVMMNTGAVP